MTEASGDDRIHADSITITAHALPHGAVTSARIADDAIEVGNVIEDLQNGDPKMIEAMILTALSRTTLNGISDMGKEQARHFLALYRQHVIAEAQQ
ncbi:hypothetical protein [Streptomyces ardesiacus]|uniref:hypothetical protein n=1 Tax=Streptomyces ardesiacus TaxID=285564 RepID=UPI00369A6221